LNYSLGTIALDGAVLFWLLFEFRGKLFTGALKRFATDASPSFQMAVDVKKLCILKNLDAKKKLSSYSLRLWQSTLH